MTAALIDVIQLEDDDKADPPNPEAGDKVPIVADTIMREASASQVSRISPAKAAVKPVGPSALAQASIELVATALTLLLAPSTALTALLSL